MNDIPDSKIGRPTPSRHRLVRGALASFGLLSLFMAGSNLVEAWSHGLARLFWVSLIAIPALAVGLLSLLLGVAGDVRSATPKDSMINCASLRSAAAWPGLVEPECPWQNVACWLLRGWACIGLLVLARCLLIAFREGPIAVPNWGWAVPLSAIAGMIWARRWNRFLRHWGRCRLRLLHRPERGRPLVGFIEAGRHFQPTHDFHFRLTYQRWSWQTYWPPHWTAEATVPRERMEPTEQGHRIPFDFLSRGGPTPALDPGRCQRWRLVFSTRLQGHPYSESFVGHLPIQDVDLSTPST